MKTVTEFPALNLRNALKTADELTAAGKTPEELPAALGEALKVEGDRLKFLLTALEVLRSGKKQLSDLRRVVVLTLNEGEKAPSGSVQKDGNCFLAEYLLPLNAPRHGHDRPDGKRRGDSRDRRKRRGDREFRRDRGEPGQDRDSSSEDSSRTEGREGREGRRARPPRRWPRKGEDRNAPAGAEASNNASAGPGEAQAQGAAGEGAERPEKRRRHRQRKPRVRTGSGGEVVIKLKDGRVFTVGSKPQPEAAAPEATAAAAPATPEASNEAAPAPAPSSTETSNAS